MEASGKQIRAEMNRLVNEQNRMTIGSDEYIAHAKKIKELREYLKEHAQNIGSAASAWSEMYYKVMQFGTGIGGFTQILSSLDNITSILKQVVTDLAAMMISIPMSCRLDASFREMRGAAGPYAPTVGLAPARVIRALFVGTH